MQNCQLIWLTQCILGVIEFIACVWKLCTSLSSLSASSVQNAVRVANILFCIDSFVLRVKWYSEWLSNFGQTNGTAAGLFGSLQKKIAFTSLHI